MNHKQHAALFYGCGGLGLLSAALGFFAWAMNAVAALVALAVIGQVLAAFWLGIWFEQRASRKEEGLVQ